MTDYIALRRHVQDEHPPGSGLSLYLRNDVLAERHAAVCAFRVPSRRPDPHPDKGETDGS